MADSTPAADELFRGDGRIRLDLFSDRAGRALRAALDSAVETNWESVRSPHLFIGLLKEPDATLLHWAERAGIKPSQLVAEFQQLFQEPAREPPALSLHREFLSDNLIRILRRALQRARRHGRDPIASIDLLLGVLTSPNSVVVECMKRSELPVERLVELAELSEQEMDGS